MAHWHLLDSGDADMGYFRDHKEAIQARRESYATAAGFVDTRALLPISREFPIVKCADPCMIQEACDCPTCDCGRIDRDSLNPDALR